MSALLKNPIAWKKVSRQNGFRPNDVEPKMGLLWQGVDEGLLGSKDEPVDRIDHRVPDGDGQEGGIGSRHVVGLVLAVDGLALEQEEEGVGGDLWPMLNNFLRP